MQVLKYRIILIRVFPFLIFLWVQFFGDFIFSIIVLENANRIYIDKKRTIVYTDDLLSKRIEHTWLTPRVNSNASPKISYQL